MSDRATVQLPTPHTRRPNWPTPQPIAWECPRCGSGYLTPELSPRCATCGFREHGA
jgi:uncharacterized protein (DUF983 family)